MKLYLAGPLFTVAEREFNKRLGAALLTLGHDVWLPQENEPRDKSAASIFDKDVEGIDWCDIVVACMDGPDPDSGTAWECGYAYHAEKDIVAYRTDVRSAEDSGVPFNLMLTESATYTIQFGTDITIREIAVKIDILCRKIEQLAA